MSLALSLIDDVRQFAHHHGTVRLTRQADALTKELGAG
jgi:hypothetical protein